MNLERLEDQVHALIDQNQKVEAIKLVRETTGWGLRESKDYVDTLARAALPALSPADETTLKQEVPSSQPTMTLESREPGDSCARAVSMNSRNCGLCFGGS